MAKTLRRHSHSKARLDAGLGAEPENGDQTGRALAQWHQASKAPAIKRTLSHPPQSDVSLLPWQRAMLLASLRHEDVDSLSLPNVVSPSTIPRLPSVPLVTWCARKNRVVNVVPVAEATLDTGRRLTALSFFWLAHLMQRSAVRLYFRRLMTARSASVVLSLGRALGRRAVAVMFGSRRKRRMQAHKRGHC